MLKKWFQREWKAGRRKILKQIIKSKEGELLWKKIGKLVWKRKNVLYFFEGKIQTPLHLIGWTVDTSDQ